MVPCPLSRALISLTTRFCPVSCRRGILSTVGQFLLTDLLRANLARFFQYTVARPYSIQHLWTAGLRWIIHAGHRGGPLGRTNACAGVWPPAMHWGPRAIWRCNTPTRPAQPRCHACSKANTGHRVARPRGSRNIRSSLALVWQLPPKTSLRKARFFRWRPHGH